MNSSVAILIVRFYSNVEQLIGDVLGKLERKLHIVQTIQTNYENNALQLNSVLHQLANMAESVAEQRPLRYNTDDVDQNVFSIKVCFHA